jgi:hypothetical protein
MEIWLKCSETMQVKNNPGGTLHCNKNPIYVFHFLVIARPQSQFPYSCVCGRYINSLDLSTYFLQQNRQINCGNI